MVVSLRPKPQHVKQLRVSRIADRYTQLQQIGSGAYGVVYRARDKRDNSLVALKKIELVSCESDEEGVPSSSLREIGLLKDLKHPGVVRLLEVQICSSKLYLVFEHLDLDLKMLLDRHRSGLPGDLVKSYMWQLLNGLAYCHARRVLHRDLKLQNLLVDRQGNIKLADFGLARSIGLPIRTYTHEVVTLWYRSPELILKTTYYGPSVDMWSLGCIFAEMLTSCILFPGDSEIDQLYRIFRTLGTPNDDIWPGFSKLPGCRRFSNFQARGLGCFIGYETKQLDLLNKLLTYNPSTRISALEALAHPYMEGAANLQPCLSEIF